MKAVDVGDDSFAEYNGIAFNDESNGKDPEFKVCDHVRISKFKNVFAKGYKLNWSEEIFVAKKKNTLPSKYVTSDSNGEEIVKKFL